MQLRSLVGERVSNYVVREKVGEGGMGIVYRAEHTRLPRQAAIKVLLPEACANPTIVSRFFNEAQAASALDNPHVVEVMDFGELETGESYIVMEWLEGETLGALIAREGKLPLDRALDVLAQIGDALVAAHDREIVHRDLKPDNIFVVRRPGKPDLVKVLDFGIAKLGEAENRGMVKTKTGVVMGTPAYMSPEQCRAAASVDARADVYSLGVIGFQLISGHLPFDRESFAEMLAAHLFEAPPSLLAVDPSAPPWLAAVLACSLEKAIDRRFATMRAFLDALSAGPAGLKPTTSATSTVMLPNAPVEPPRSRATAPLPAFAPPKTITTFTQAADEATALATPARKSSMRRVGTVAMVALAAAAVGASAWKLKRPRVTTTTVTTTPALRPVAEDPARAPPPVPPPQEGPAAAAPQTPAEPVSPPPARRTARRKDLSEKATTHPTEAPNADPLKTKSPLLDGLDEVMRNRPKLERPSFPR